MEDMLVSNQLSVTDDRGPLVSLKLGNKVIINNREVPDSEGVRISNALFTAVRSLGYSINSRSIDVNKA